MNQPNVQIVQCPQCGAKNKLPADKPDDAARCGKCGSTLRTDEAAGGGPEVYTIRCTSCRTKNRIPASKINDTPLCGKCKSALETKELFNGSPMMVNDGTFDTSVLKSPLPVLLYCWSTGCPSCQVAGPIVDQFAADSKGRVRVAKLDVGTSPMVASRYSILGVPFILIFDGGQLKESFPGAVSKHDIMMKMAHYI